MSIDNKTQLEPSGQLAHLGATEVKPASEPVELKRSGLLQNSAAPKIVPAGSPCPTCCK